MDDHLLEKKTDNIADKFHEIWRNLSALGDKDRGQVEIKLCADNGSKPPNLIYGNDPQHILNLNAQHVKFLLTANAQEMKIFAPEINPEDGRKLNYPNLIINLMKSRPQDDSDGSHRQIESYDITGLDSYRALYIELCASKPKNGYLSERLKKLFPSKPARISALALILRHGGKLSTLKYAQKIFDISDEDIRQPPSIISKAGLEAVLVKAVLGGNISLVKHAIEQWACDPNALDTDNPIGLKTLLCKIFDQAQVQQIDGFQTIGYLLNRVSETTKRQFALGSVIYDLLARSHHACWPPIPPGARTKLISIALSDETIFETVFSPPAGTREWKPPYDTTLQLINLLATYGYKPLVCKLAEKLWPNGFRNAPPYEINELNSSAQELLIQESKQARLDDRPDCKETEATPDEMPRANTSSEEQKNNQGRSSSQQLTQRRQSLLPQAAPEARHHHQSPLSDGTPCSTLCAPSSRASCGIM